MTTFGRGVLSLVLLVALVAACGDDDDTSAATTSTTSSVPAEETTTSADVSTTTVAETTTTVSAETEVIEAYEASQRAVSESGDPPDPDHPALAATFTGDALENARISTRGLRDQGLGARNTIETHPRDVVVDGARATLSDCFVDRTEIYLLADGMAQGPPGETVVNVDVTMERVDGTWKTAKSQRLEEPCTPG